MADAVPGYRDNQMFSPEKPFHFFEIPCPPPFIITFILFGALCFSVKTPFYDLQASTGTVNRHQSAPTMLRLQERETDSETKPKPGKWIAAS